MGLSQINVRVDEDLKKQADEVMKQLGTTPTQAITWFYQYMSEYRQLPFTIKTIISDKTEQTRYLLRQIRHIHEYCQILFSTNLKLKEERGYEFSMNAAQHIHKLQKELIDDTGDLNDEDIAEFMSVLDRLFNMRDRLISYTAGDIEGQRTQLDLTGLSRKISLLEQHYATLE